MNTKFAGHFTTSGKDSITENSIDGSIPPSSIINRYLLRENYAQLGGRPKLFSQVWGKSPERVIDRLRMEVLISSKMPPKASSSGNARIFIPIETKGKFFEKTLDHYPDRIP